MTKNKMSFNYDRIMSMGTIEEKRAAIVKNPEVIGLYTLEPHPYELYSLAAMIDIRVLSVIPKAYVPYELLKQLVIKSGYNLYYIPEDLKTKELELLALSNDSRAIRFVRDATYEMVLLSIDTNYRLNILDIPKQFLSESIVNMIRQKRL